MSISKIIWQTYKTDFCDLPENFDFLSLYYFEGHNWIDDKTEFGAEYIHKSINQFSAGQAMIYSNIGAKKLLRAVKRLGIEYRTDCFIFEQARRGLVNGYSIKPDNIVFLKHTYDNIKSLINLNNIRNTEKM